MISKRQAGVVAGFALAADAFMIPSTMSMPEAKGEGIEALKALDPSRLADPSGYPGQIVKLPCPKCELPGGFDADMSLILNWTVVENGRMLTLNDAPFLGSQDVEPASSYSFLQMPTGLPDFLTYFMSSQSKVSYQRGPESEPQIIEPLDLNVHVNKRQISATDDTDAQLIDVDFHIDDASAGRPTEMDAVSLRIIQDERGNLNVLEIVRVPADGSVPDIDGDKPSPDEEEQTFEILPTSPIPPTSPNGQPDIPTLLHKPQVIDCHGLPLSICQMQHMVKTKIAAMHNAISAALSGSDRPSRGQHRPCMKGRPNGPPGLHLKGGVNKFTNPDGTPKFHPHPHHHHNRMMHRALRCLRRFFFGFIVPVMIGVAAGMTASLAGMAVGTGLAMIWFRIRRGGKRGQQGAVRLEQGEAHESEGLMKRDEAEAEPRESEEMLPAYEEKEAVRDE